MRIFILTGAGVSAESGLGTFRDADGLWTKYDLSEVATPEGFARDPAKVHDFYNARRANALDARPNAAHHALARLSHSTLHDVTVVTQNVDTLHEQAGVEAIHMHGRLDRATCHSCRETWEAPRVMSPHHPCAACGATATRPDIVWFGEMPYQMDRIQSLLAVTELFVAIGTSGQVYPAAGFVAEANAAGAHTIEINLDPSDVSTDFDEHILGAATLTVPDWVDRLLGQA